MECERESSVHSQNTSVVFIHVRSFSFYFVSPTSTLFVGLYVGSVSFGDLQLPHPLTFSGHGDNGHGRQSHQGSGRWWRRICWPFGWHSKEKHEVALGFVKKKLFTNAFSSRTRLTMKFVCVFFFLACFLCVLCLCMLELFWMKIE